VVGVDGADAALLARGEHHELVASAHDPAADLPREPAVIEVRSDDVLNRIPELVEAPVVYDGDGLEVLEDARSFVPCGLVTLRSDVHTLERADREEAHVADGEIGGELRELCADTL